MVGGNVIPAARSVLLGMLVSLAPHASEAQRPLKVFISADMEGIAGVVTADQLGPSALLEHVPRGQVGGRTVELWPERARQPALSRTIVTVRAAAYESVRPTVSASVVSVIVVRIATLGATTSMLGSSNRKDTLA
jgi:hypothetical protein